jgi:hypothetical protein
MGCTRHENGRALGATRGERAGDLPTHSRIIAGWITFRPLAPSTSVIVSFVRGSASHSSWFEVRAPLPRPDRRRRRARNGDRPLPRHLRPHPATPSSRRSNTAPGLPRHMTQRPAEGPARSPRRGTGGSNETSRHRAGRRRWAAVLSAAPVPVEVRLTGNSYCGWEQRRSGRSPGTLIQRRDITGR